VKKHPIKALLLLMLLMPLIVMAQQPSKSEVTKSREIQPAETQQTPEPSETEKTSGTQPRDGDFKPDEEISEDFPVPLPSDI
jgi:hypothetical protein